MSWFIDNKMFIFLEYINLMFIFVIVKLCYKITHLNYIFITVLFMVSILVYWILHSILNRKLYKFLFILAVIIAAGVLYYYNADYIIKLVNEQIVNNVISINTLVSDNKETSFVYYKPIIVLTLPLIIWITTFFSCKGLYNFVLIVSFAAITTLWYLGYTQELKEYLFYYILITLSTFSINGFKTNVRRMSRKGVKVTIDSKNIFLYTIIIGVLIAGVTEYMPQEYKGKYSSDIQSKFINKYVQREKNEEEKGKELKYDLYYSGYSSNNKKLGGPITVNKIVAFRVKSDKPYYLKGVVKDTYDGFIWSQSEENYKLMNGKNENVFQDGFSKGYMGRNKTLSIYPDGLNSTTLFSPEYSYNAKVDKGNIFYDSIPTFITGSSIHKSYDIDFYGLSEEGDAIYKDGINKSKQEVDPIYYYDNYKRYLQIPDNISSRVYNLVYSLTGDKKYNYEKVKAIEDYLKSNYKYSLKVSNVPEGQEFLDYFLFTEKKGYCTYFATAETIMCRIAGIPARYVEGFNMSNDKDKNGLYEVKNENAHAWTEVLYKENQYIGLWYTVDAVPNAVDYIHKEEEVEKAAENTKGNTSTGMVKLPNRNIEDGTQEGGNTAAVHTLPKYLVRLIYIITAVIFFNILMLFRVFIKKRKILNCHSIIPIYVYSLERLEAIGVKRAEGISDMEFVLSLPEELREKLKAAVMLSYAEFFGKKQPDSLDKEKLYIFIEGYARKKQNIFSYFAKKYYTFKKIALIKAKIVLLYKRITYNKF